MIRTAYLIHKLHVYFSPKTKDVTSQTLFYSTYNALLHKLHMLRHEKLNAIFYDQASLEQLSQQNP